MALPPLPDDIIQTRLLHVPYSKSGIPDIDILGSINGLVCLFHYNLDEFIIWNPAIRQAMKINSPARQGMESYPSTRSFFGFCWDAMENDFKVVISYFKTYTSPLSLYAYSCNFGSWSLPRDSTFSDGLWLTNEVPSAIVTGVPYWTYSPYPFGTQLPLTCFKYGGEIVFSAHGMSKCYNHKTNKVIDLQNQKGYIRKCFCYQESLIFLEGMKSQHQMEPTLWM
ncbi:hypothetical protein POM88_050012 [Heracleum sosnowskyi]|uniref:Uncharacterized protein n=1 Tax=Heracleum sosnowskyi TaxID=360622 RepID=A0AAD8GZH9_9APIA|nr:hypothetical protein POM88_050012 [Heracleum sosnowskyi]